jgi:HEAT repeat protein
MPASDDKLDDALRALLRGTWTFETAPPALVALGPRALDRLLDATDGVFFRTETEWRDYGIYRQHAVAAFAKADMGRVLSAMKKRKWSAVEIVLSGVALVRDARVVPFLVAAYADPDSTMRQRAIEGLRTQRDARAKETLIRALKDRSPDVRRSAKRALEELVGDVQKP